MDLKACVVYAFVLILTFHKIFAYGSTINNGMGEGFSSKYDTSFIQNLKNSFDSGYKYVKEKEDKLVTHLQDLPSLVQKLNPLNVISKAEDVLSPKKILSNNFKKLAKLDPDVKKDVGQLIVGQGYPMENYTVKTQDGFLLGLYRIPHGKKHKLSFTSTNTTKPSPKSRPAVFLQHGLFTSAADWLMNFDENSLGFVLADAGYDVWMGNSRGNTYSRRHVTLNPNENKFWDWSFDEMAKYDAPANIDFILNKTGHPTLSYIGHSQGTMIAFAMFSSLPEYQKKVNLFIGLAPVMSIAHLVSPIKYVSELNDDHLYFLFGRKDFLPNDIIIKSLADTVCATSVIDELCVNILFVMCGSDISNLNKTRIPVYLNNSPAGVSVKDIVHFAQMYRQKRFARYDFGSPNENMKHYGQAIPPIYNVSKVAVPSVLFTGGNDWLADPKDVITLMNTLGNIKASYEFPTWNHLDFVYGQNAGSVCYQTIVRWLTTVSH